VIDINKIRQAYGYRKQWPIYYVDQEQLNQVLDAVPELLDELERMREAILDIKSIGNRPDIQEWRKKALGESK